MVAAVGLLAACSVALVQLSQTVDARIDRVLTIEAYSINGATAQPEPAFAASVAAELSRLMAAATTTMTQPRIELCPIDQSLDATAALGTVLLRTVDAWRIKPRRRTAHIQIERVGRYLNIPVLTINGRPLSEAALRYPGGTPTANAAAAQFCGRPTRISSSPRTRRVTRKKALLRSARS